MNRGIAMAIFNRDRTNNINTILSNVPTNVPIGRSFVERRLVLHEPSNGVSAPQIRGSGFVVCDNILGKFAANAPVYIMVPGRGAGSGSCTTSQFITEPSRTSCITFRGCGKFRSCHNNKRFDNEMAANVITMNTVTVSTLGGGKVAVNARVGGYTSMVSHSFSSCSTSVSLLGGVRFTILSGGGTRSVGARVLGTESGHSDINNMLRATILGLPININRP